MLFSGKPSSPTGGPDSATPTTCTTYPCPPTCTILSETFATAPFNRARKTIGVGERVLLTFSLGDASWTASGGNFNSDKGRTVIFVAPDRMASVIIRAIGGGCTASVSFQVIEPKGVYMEIFEILGSSNTLGFLADVYITPDTVSFKYIDVMEGDCKATVHGYFENEPFANMAHSGRGAGGMGPVRDVVVGKGSKMEGWDKAIMGHLDPPYLKGGDFDWPIPWYFRVRGGKWSTSPFATVHQRCLISPLGEVTVSKDGATASTNDWYMKYSVDAFEHLPGRVENYLERKVADELGKTEEQQTKDAEEVIDDLAI